MMRPNQFHRIALILLIGTTLAMGSLRDALINAPNGAEVEQGAPATTGSVPKQR